MTSEEWPGEHSQQCKTDMDKGQSYQETVRGPRPVHSSSLTCPNGAGFLRTVYVHPVPFKEHACP